MRKFFALFLLVAMTSVVAHAFNFNRNNFYSVVQFDKTGSGTVYASTDKGSVESTTQGGHDFRIVEAHDKSQAIGNGNISTNVTWTFDASPATGYKFLRWEDNSGNLVTNNTSFTRSYETKQYSSQNDAISNPQDKFKAVFDVRKFYSVVNVINPTNGSVAVKANKGTTQTVSRTGSKLSVSYIEKASASVSWTLTATPASGYEFMRWEDNNGNVLSTNGVYTVTYTTGEYDSQNDAIAQAPQGTFNAVFVPKKELAQAVANPEAGFICLSDLTCVYTVSNADDNSGLLFCKDNNKFANKDVNENGYEDYMFKYGFDTRSTHDESNWVVLHVPAQVAGDMNYSNFELKNLSKVFVNGDASGCYTLQQLPQVEGSTAYNYNTYIPANFLGTQKHLFFASPKPFEVCVMVFAMWDGEKFIMIPSNYAGHNSYNLEGEFEIDDTLYSKYVSSSGDNAQFLTDHVYRFLGIVAPKGAFDGIVSGNGMKKVAGTQANTIFLLDEPAVQGAPAGDGLLTGIDAVDADAQVIAVKYCNLNGVMSDTPHDGINIVVEYLDNGTTKSHKQMF